MSTDTHASVAKWSATLAASSTAGALSWLAGAYPFDVVKTIQQTAPDSTPRTEMRVRSIVYNGLHSHGLRFFVQGLGPTLLRTVPSAGALLGVYEMGMAALEGVVQPPPTGLLSA